MSIISGEETTSRTLSPGDAVTIGELVNAVLARSPITFLPSQPRWNGPPVVGELRGFINGPKDFGSLGWGTDVRDAYVWITADGFERSEPVSWLCKMIREGGCVFERRDVQASVR